MALPEYRRADDLGDPAKDAGGPPESIVPPAPVNGEGLVSGYEDNTGLKPSIRCWPVVNRCGEGLVLKAE